MIENLKKYFPVRSGLFNRHKSNVQAVDDVSFFINRGETFYRVRSGPYSRNKVNALSSRLKSNSINSLVIKLKQ